ncbi:MAG: hypothetical protein UR39_C0001G0086 [Candidatus Woesebacteria bacterium GW2011_GWA1_33_30]|uniref:Glycosyl transferase family 1 domain-containing protein n=1 Tax=Candidatus Woesebacteria bacterium GW2011_GWA2_33_28 TaxID=1618561 RepID=A0A0G0AAI1_9BACT|nr:MAG: hypothetical protein UR38_C0001G0087 [Candidatus Woesebacteria bacterium GW2011_GWA2_33_28]KKP49053.1 MAG: hypothetical protein UR39_C0001G0086 [Candidatus Woesebacteria bacterium GW2011_GWA1_33_30]KKP49839.1 MAG: hypothetical protein UR40_C0003G0011 [Microgenomates group bacterium GW2011_GWC1_33_32]KKP52645.1 MAG: hypothetical protein UR44_C0001G0087 [Candidatus Woesebacteria bacterium GW2011_GWB1_33_38]KKP58822.1 MAG: hypothetical protein UR48_C0001G0026 [Microgenomates group bacteriu
MGKASLYNPYLDTLGGGEKYTLSFAKVLAEDLGFDVDIEWKDKNIKEKLTKRFGIKLPKNVNFVKDINRGEGYDVCFWVSDGSVPTLRAKNNYLHFQVPFTNVNGNSLLNKMKLFRIKKIICNSKFTKNVIDKEYTVNSLVLYPPVDTKLFKPKRKENIVLYVGRFSNLVQNKGHKILITEFKKLVKDKSYHNWKLILAGGTEVGVGEYVNKLKKICSGYNIDIVESPSFKKIVDIYGKSKFFWSAAGFGIDEEKNPEKVEHFGITLVESMAAGCVPIVFNSGGFKEIIVNGINGFLWEYKSDLVKITKKVLSKPGIYKSISKSATESAKEFSHEIFKKKMLELMT